MSSAPAEKDRLQSHYSDRDQQQGQTHGVTAGSGLSRDAGHVTSQDAAAPGPLAPLPPYSSPASGAQEAALRQQQQQKQGGRSKPTVYPGLPVLDYRLYQPPLFALSADKTAIRTTAPYLSASPQALSEVVHAQATVPPKPIIEITGNRGRKVDFSLKLNLMPLLVPEDPQRRMNYIRCVASGELALRGGSKPGMVPNLDVELGSNGLPEAAVEAWCRRFCEDTTPVKEFVLERQVANLDVVWLEGQIRTLVAATGYRGVVNVAFPVAHARVVIHSPDRINKFITTVTSLFTGKSTYEVVKAVWPFATHRNGERGRRYAVQSEETWWHEWRDPIRYAISTRRAGWVTNEDKLEALMEGAGKGIGSFDWGSEHV